MKTQKLIRLISAALLTTVAAGASAAGPIATAPTTGASALAGDIDAASLARAQQKLAHAVQVANYFSASAAAEGLSERWHAEMVTALMQSPERVFDQVQATPNVRDAITLAGTLAVSPKSATGTAKDLGDTGDDLTYIPLAAPCRIVDTRPSSGGSGTLAPGVARNFSFTQSNSSQGGSGCTPFGGYVGGGVPGAAAINITVIGGATAPAGAFLQAYPGGGSTTTSWLNFGPGQIIANEGVLGISSTFVFTLKASATVDAIVDVFGSFVRPQATALECTTVTSTNSFLGVVAASCTAAYTLTGGGCRSSSITDHTYQAYPSSATTYGCGFWPEGSGTLGTTLTAYATCCRTPGR